MNNEIRELSFDEIEQISGGKGGPTWCGAPPCPVRTSDFIPGLGAIVEAVFKSIP